MDYRTSLLPNVFLQPISMLQSMQMSCVAKKCSVLRVTTKMTHHLISQYTTRGIPLAEVDYQSYFRVEMSQDMSWGTHINIISNHATKLLHCFTALQAKLSHKTQETLHTNVRYIHTWSMRAVRGNLTGLNTYKSWKECNIGQLTLREMTMAGSWAPLG